MKIFDERKNTIHQFCEILQGECFINKEDDLMMRLDGVESDGCVVWNVVRLADGETFSFDDSDIAIPVKAKITIYN